MKQTILNNIKKTLNIGRFENSLRIGYLRNVLSKILNLQKAGSYDTRYSQPILLDNGKTLTIRVADHQATEENFITHNNTDLNISIIFGKNTDSIIIAEEISISQIYEEVLYKSECFSEQNFHQALTEILQGIAHALENNGRFKKGELGEYIIQREMENTEQLKMENTIQTETLGSIRQAEAPKKSLIAYKLFRVENGQPYPLFIDNKSPLPLGVWLDADSATIDVLQQLEKGFYLVDKNGNATQLSKSPGSPEVKELSAQNNGSRYFGN